MEGDSVYCIGLMSGTSLDGVDLVYVKFNDDLYNDFDIIYADTIKYSVEWEEKLREAVDNKGRSLKSLDIEYGALLGGMINEFKEKYSIDQVDFVASHGHTVFHQPKNGITLQIGSGSEIARVTENRVICDFRTQDVLFGGQGAPLVPIGDELLFSQHKYCVNLGGFANVSYKKSDERIAFDVCPVNIIMNYYVKRLGFDYDDKGVMASEGVINKELLGELNALEFYKKEYPKSLGLEWVQENVFPLIDKYEANIPNILRTIVEHSAQQIAEVLRGESSVLFTGGGVYNSFLMKRMSSYTKVEYSLASEELIEFKEALIFAFLGLLRLKGEVNCLSSVTGASRDHSSGVIFNP